MITQTRDGTVYEWDPPISLRDEVRVNGRKVLFTALAVLTNGRAAKAIFEQEASGFPQGNRALLAAAENQARILKGNPGGGQWVDTPGKVLNGLRPDDDILGDAPVLKNNSPISAAEGANPNWGVNEDYDVNCQKTSAVYELRRRGYDVAASGGVEGRGLQIAQWFDAGKHLNRMSDDDFLQGQGVAVGKEVTNRLATIHPKGARGYLTVGWPGGGGHVVNWEIDNDGIAHVIDGQSGREVTNDAEFWANTIPSKTYAGRLDNAPLTPAIEDALDRKRVTAAGGPGQARVLKGNRAGGQWLDTPSAVLADLGWAGEADNILADRDTYFVPDTEGGNFDIDYEDAPIPPRDISTVLPDPKGSTFTDKERDMLSAYTGEFAEELNQNLRYGIAGDAQVRDIDSAMKKSRLAEAATLYRMIKPELLPDLAMSENYEQAKQDLDSLVGKVIRDRAFLSTSTSEYPQYADSDEGWPKLIMKVPAGTPAINMKPISHLPWENEVLLDRNTPLAITGYEIDEETGEYSIFVTVAEPMDDSLTAAGPKQARAPKGTRIGGQWIETPDGLYDSLGGEYGPGHGPNAAGMAERLGAPGDPVSLKEMQKDPMAYRDRINPSHKEYPGNCQRVVFATELQARGFDASAPYASGNEGDSYLGDITERLDLSGTWREGYGSYREWTLPERNMTQLQGADAIAMDPPGARYFIKANNKRNGSAHIMNAEMGPNGKLLIYDGQSGSTKFMTSAFTDLQIMRVDDLPLEEFIFDGIDGNPPWVVPAAEEDES